MIRTVLPCIVLGLTASSALAAPTSQPRIAGATSRPAVASAASQPAITYLGKPRTIEWLNSKYTQFHDKLVIAGGKCYDIGPAVAMAAAGKPIQCIGATPAAAGEVRLLPAQAKILQVLKDDDAIAIIPAFHARVFGGGDDAGYSDMQAAILSTPEVSFHLSGLPKGLVDGAALKAGPVVCVGTYAYGDVVGSQRTVQDFAAGRPPTKQEFAAALATGLELAAYERIPATAQTDGAFSVPRSARGVALKPDWFVLKKIAIP